MLTGRRQLNELDTALYSLGQQILADRRKQHMESGSLEEVPDPAINHPQRPAMAMQRRRPVGGPGNRRGHPAVFDELKM